MERVTALDASFLALDGGNSHLHVGSIVVVEGPAPTPEAFTAHLASRLDRAPRLRQRLQGVPLGIARPVWVDDDAFDLAMHVRRTTLPGEGGVDELEDLVSRVMARRLDRRRPLWELWVVDGIDGEHWALVSKVHQAVLAAIGGEDLVALLLDDEPLPVDDGGTGPTAWSPRPAPSSVDLVRDVLGEVVRPTLAGDLVGSALRAPTALLGTARAAARGLGQLGGLVAPGSAPGLTGPVGPDRSYRWLQFPLADLQAVADGLGSSVDDVVLAMVTTGFRDLLHARDVDPVGRRVRAMLPLRQGDGDGADHVRAVITDLPVRVEDPTVLLATITERTRRPGRSGRPVDARAMAQLAGFAPPALLGLGLRAAARAAAHVGEVAVDTIVANAPGPQATRWVAGRPVFHAFPYLPLTTPVRLAVAVWSYDGEVTFGVTADPDGVPDVGDFTAGVEAGLLELLHAVDGT